MKTVVSLLLIVGLSASAHADDSAKKPKPRFTVGKETTYVTGRLDKDGYIDYSAALNERLGKGVTAENNANVLLWKALGPRPEGGKGMPAEFFKLMGMEEPAEKGEYFIDIRKFGQDRLGLDASELKALEDELAQATRHSWTAKDYPRVAEWLKANEKPLALAAEATNRSHYFNPLVPSKSNLSNTGLIASLLSGVQKCRGLAGALAGRAMLRAGEGRFDDAWQDLLACHRLGRHVGRGGCLIEPLVGIAIDSIAGRADLVFLERAGRSAKQIETWRRDLESLPPLPVIADKIDFFERCNMLETVTLVDRHGLAYLEGLGGGAPAKDADPRAALLLADVNWDPALKNINRWYDRLAAAAREPDRRKRDRQFESIEDELKRLKNDFKGEWNNIAQAIIEGKGAPEAKGKAVGSILIHLMLPATHKVQQAADRAEQIQQNLQVAFALAAYRADNKRYPEKLDALAPKYLAKIPDDMFTGKPLVYRPAEKGYLLYSFGPNGKDDEGRWFDDMPPGDDPSVRMPIPELKPRK